MNPDLNIACRRKYRMIFSGEELTIKGYYEITSYENDVISLSCGDDCIIIRGIEICIDFMNADEICIRGKLADISFVYGEGSD